MIWPKNWQNRLELRSQRFFRVCSDKIGVKILSKHNSENIFGISLSSWSVSTPNIKAGTKFYFLTSASIFKILSLVRKPKRTFLWKKNGIVLLFLSHGTGLAKKKTGKNEHGEKCNALMVMPGQVRSGQFRACKVVWIWKYIYNIQHSCCTEAT